jgi:NADPH:quinone reductase-like Zn-dependent oxidoreductase
MNQSHDATFTFSDSDQRSLQQRETLSDEVRDMPPEPREFVRSRLRDLLADAGFAFIIHAHLPLDDASQARTTYVLEQRGKVSA